MPFPNHQQHHHQQHNRPPINPRSSSLPNNARRPKMPRLRERDSMEEVLRPREPGSFPAPPADAGLSKARWSTLTFLLLLSFLFSLLDTTIVSTSLLKTADQIGNFADSSWVLLAYLLTYMGFSIIFAKLSDIFGRLMMLQVSWLLFGCFSIGCGAARTMDQLIVLRAFQGVGGAGLYSLPIVCLQEIIPPRKRQLIGGCIAITLSVSFVLGPILGGVIPYLSTWRVLYFINIPFAVLISLGLFLLYPKRRQEATSGLEMLRKIDFLGAVLLLAGTMLLVFAVQEAGSLKYPWDSVPILVTLSLSAVCWIIFWGWETLLSLRGRHVMPIFPLSLAGHRVYLSCLITTLLVGFSFMTTVITLPERSQIVDGDNVLMAGVNLLPLLGAVAVGSFAAGPISKTRNRTSQTMMVGCALTAIGAGLMTTLETIRLQPKPLYGYEVILGLGFGLCMASATMISTVQARGKDLAVGNGAIAQARVFGSAIGLGVWTIIFNKHAATARLDDLLTPDQRTMVHRSPVNALMLPEPARSLVRGIHSSAFTDMMLVLVAVSGGSFIASLFTYQANPQPVHFVPPPPPQNRARLKQGLPAAGRSARDRERGQELQDMENGHPSGAGGGGSAGSDSASRSESSFDIGRMPTMPRQIIPR